MRLACLLLTFIALHAPPADRAAGAAGVANCCCGVAGVCTCCCEPLGGPLDDSGAPVLPPGAASCECSDGSFPPPSPPLSIPGVERGAALSASMAPAVYSESQPIVQLRQSRALDSPFRFRSAILLI